LPVAGQPALPLRMKVLLVTTLHATGDWLTEAFAADGAAQINLDEVIGVTAGLARLRDEVYDAILVTHDPGVLDAMEMAEAVRTGGSDEPLIILGNLPPQDLDALCYEAGADDYCCVADTTVRGLLWKFARAIQRSNLVKENRRLVQAERHRLQQEHHEAERLLEQQRALITDLEQLRDAPSDAAGNLPLAGEAREESDEDDADDCPPVKSSLERTTVELPSELVDHYREMLRAYVIMGAGNLTHEMTTLADLLAASNSTSQRTMQLHVQVLEELVEGLGNRSARHVMNRADLLVLEVMGHLADGYRQRYYERRHPPRQRLLDGFELAADGEVAVCRAAA
jgi:DNA-binding response OmpR family regulator